MCVLVLNRAFLAFSHVRPVARRRGVDVLNSVLGESKGERRLNASRLWRATMLLIRRCGRMHRDRKIVLSWLFLEFDHDEFGIIQGLTTAGLRRCSAS
jgi:hypothetical protein